MLENEEDEENGENEENKNKMNNWLYELYYSKEKNNMKIINVCNIHENVIMGLTELKDGKVVTGDMYGKINIWKM